MADTVKYTTIYGPGFSAEHVGVVNFGASPGPQSESGAVGAASHQLAPATDARAFISYAVAHRPIADVVGQFIADRFPDLSPVFIADSTASVPIGTDWFAAINAALRSVRVLFVLASQASLESRWVSFEIGWAWSRDIPVVFLCYDGITPDNLPSPYNTRQAILLSCEAAEDAMHAVVSSVSQVLGLTPREGVDIHLFAEALANRMRGASSAV